MHLVVALMLLTAFACSASAEGGQGVSLSFFTKNRKVIPLVLSYEALTVTDIKLPDLLVTNSLTEAVTPGELRVIGLHGKEEAIRLRAAGDVVRALIDATNPALKQVFLDQKSRERMATAFGEWTLHASKMAESSKIEPGQSALVLLSQLLYFHYVGVLKIDGLRMELDYESGARKGTAQWSVPLTAWNPGKKHTFPLKGTVYIANMPLNYMHHRQALSQEFGADMLEVRPDKTGDLVTCRKPGSGKLADYYVYRQPVHAIADGVVARVGDGFPEKDTIPPDKYTEELFEKTSARLTPKIGALNALAGNYLVVRHGDGVYGFYAHLSHHSMRVKKGDKVRAGQVLALAGSTGNSTEPHLHFQLMDSEDFFAANGLPMMFEQVPAQAMVQYLQSANSLACADGLVVTVPRK